VIKQKEPFHLKVDDNSPVSPWSRKTPEDFGGFGRKAAAGFMFALVGVVRDGEGLTLWLRPVDMTGAEVFRGRVLFTYEWYKNIKKRKD